MPGTPIWPIDGVATSGLLGVSNSLGYKVHEIEKHFHNQAYWYGKDPGDAFLLENGLVSWTLIAGAIGVMGNWMQLSNGDEIIAGPKYDLHQILITNASAAGKVYYIQLGTGAGGAQVAKTTAVIMPAATLRQSHEEIMMPRLANTDLLWARCSCETAAATVSILVGLHVYVG